MLHVSSQDSGADPGILIKGFQRHGVCMGPPALRLRAGPEQRPGGGPGGRSSRKLLNFSDLGEKNN